MSSSRQRCPWPGARCASLVLLLALGPRVQAQYVHTLGSGSFDEGVRVGLDGAGNTYGIGVFRGTFDFDFGPDTVLLTSTHHDVYVASYDPAGALRFAFRIGNHFAASEGAGDLVVSADGTFFVTGNQPFGTIDYDPSPNGTAERAASMFLASYDAGGAFRFATATERTGTARGEALALDGTGRLYAAGQFTDSLAFGTSVGDQEILVSAGNTDLFVARYATDGTYECAFRLGGVNADVATGIAADGAGNVYVAGRLGSTLTFDPDDTDGDGDTETRHGSASAPFLASYTGCGTFRFAHVFGLPHATDSNSAGRYRVAVDAENRVYLAGQIVGPVAFDPDDTNGDGDLARRESPGNGDAFLAGYTSEGVFRFVTVAADGNSATRDLVTLPSGISFVTGSFGGRVRFGPESVSDTLVSGAGTDVFVARYNAEGVYEGAFRFGGDGLDVGNGIAVDENEDIIVTGTFTGTADFDPGEGVDLRGGAGQTDLFIARYAASTLPVAAEDPHDPTDALVTHARPNPFAVSTVLHLSVPHRQWVRVSVFDAMGRRVAVLFDDVANVQPAHRLRFEAASLASGLYVVVAEGESFRLARYMTLIR